MEKKITINPYPFNNKSKLSVLSVMISLNDHDINKYFYDLNYLLTNKRDKGKIFHVTLFRMFIDNSLLSSEKFNFITKNVREIVKNIIREVTKFNKYNLDIKYKNDNDEKNFKIMGNYEYLNNFFTVKIDKTKKFIDGVERIKFLTMEKLIGKSIFLHSQNKDYNYYTYEGLDKKLIAIAKYYDYQGELADLHLSLCRINEIQHIQDFINNEDLKKNIFEKYLKNKINKYKKISYTLFPKKDKKVKNSLYVTYFNSQ